MSIASICITIISVSNKNQLFYHCFSTNRVHSQGSNSTKAYFSKILLFLQIIPFWLSVTHPVSVRLALEHPLISSLVIIEYELQHRVSPFAHVNKSMLVTKMIFISPPEFQIFPITDTVTVLQ